MARIRSIKPEFWTSLTINALTPLGALTFIGLWNHCDDFGRALDEPRLIKAAVHPLRDEVNAEEVDGILHELARLGLIVRYNENGKRYLAVSAWDEHQKVDKKRPSRLPAPPCAQGSSSELAAAADETPRRVGERSGNTPRLEQGAGSRDQGEGTGSSEQSREERIRLRCLRLAAAANRGITERLGNEQPTPLLPGAATTHDTAEALETAGVPDEFAVRVIYERARTMTTDKAVRSIGYFRGAILEAWDAEQAHRQAATIGLPTVSEDGRVVGKIDALTRMAISGAKSGDPEWIAECERMGVDYAVDYAAEGAA